MLGEKLLTKMWETLAKDGVGSLASPWQIKREGKAHAEVRRDELLMLAQAEVEANLIKQGKKKLLPGGNLVDIQVTDFESNNEVDHLGRIEPTINLDEMTFKADQQRKSDDLQAEININKTILMAEEELLRSKQEPSDRDVDPDWISRWRENAKNTKNEEVRRLWARTLAGEVKAPGAYSLRTLEFIKNLSQEEAIAISKLGQFVIGNTLLKCKTLEDRGINFSFLLHMDDLGILNGVQGGDVTGLEIKMSSRETNKYSNVLINRNRILLIESNDPKKELKLPVYQVSKIGVEVLSLGDFNADEDYMRELGRLIKAKGFDVKLALWLQTHVNQGRFFNPEII